MANIVYEIQEESTKYNSELESSTTKLHETKLKKLNTKQINHTKETLKSAKDLQQIRLKECENDKKRYKVMKKYGEVLQLIEKLLGLIPGDLKNLSTEELEEKLKELLSSRKKTEDQMMFIFYQNMVADLLKNLKNIEDDFLNKRISSSQAHKCVQESKEQIREYYKEAPEILKPTIKDASYLVTLYEQSYNAYDDKNFSLPATNLRETELNANHRAIFDDLNKKTNSLISDVTSLSNDLSKFEPQVDLSQLSKQLETTEHISRIDNWDVAQMDSAVNDLKSTTESCITKQTDINHQNEKLEERIKDITTSSKDLSATSIKESADETYLDTSIRVASNTTDAQIKQENLQSTDDDFWLGILVASAVLMEDQVVADQEFSEELAQDPNVDPANMPNENEFEAALNGAYDLKNGAMAMQELRLQQQREVMLNFNPENKKN